MNRIAIAVISPILVLLASIVQAQTPQSLAEDFKTNDGKEYKNVTVSRVEPDGIVLTTSSGISKVYFTELPKEVQERFHYDQAKSAAYSSEQAAAITEFNKRVDFEQQLCANAARIHDKLVVDAVTGNFGPDDEALLAKVGNCPEFQRINAKINASMKDMEEDAKRTNRAHENVARLEQIQRDSALQGQATANYEAKEKNRMATLDQRKALSSEIQHLYSQRQLIEKDNQNTRDITREIDAKQKVLNSLGGQF